MTPRKRVKRKREVAVKVYLSDDEMAALSKVAGAAGSTVSGWIRMLIIERIGK